MFDKLTNAFSSIAQAFSRHKTIKESVLDEHGLKIQNALIDADVPLDVARAFVAAMKNKLIGKKLQKYEDAGEIFILQMRDTIIQFLDTAAQQFTYLFPLNILCIGLQGSGKTTTLAKLAYKMKHDHPSKKILLASVDFYRPSAIEQLEVGAKKAKVDFYRSPKTTVKEAVEDIISYKNNKKYDVLLLDTAGRMHIDQPMIEELKLVKSIAKPTHTLIVLDAMIGQTSMHVATEFNKEIGFDGAIISKMDSDTRGGILFALSYLLKKPIYFIGSGEHIEDLTLFHPNRIADKIVGQGDLEGLLEEAQKKIKNPAVFEQPETFTLNEFAEQIKAMNSFGPLSKLLSYMPAGMVPQMSSDQMEKIAKDLNKTVAIVNSMTPQERIKVGILNVSRKTRIAKGAGVTVSDVDAVCKQYKEMKQMLKSFGRI